MADERPLDGDAVHHLFHAREQVHGKINAGVDLPDLKILRRGDVVFEVECVQMTDGARDLKEDHIPGIAARIGLAAGIGAELERPCAFDGRGEQADSTVLQQLAASRDQVPDGLSTTHDTPPSKVIKKLN